MEPTDSHNISAENCVFPKIIGYPVILINIIGSLLGSLSNILLWFVVLKNTRLRTLSNYFILNLSIADLLVTAVTQPLFITYNIFLMQGRYLETIEKAYSMVACFSCIASILNITSISIDRLIVLKYPLKKRTILTKRRGLEMMVVTWFLAAVYTILSCVFQETKIWISLTLGYFTVCYITIISAHTHMYIVSHRFVRRRKQQVRRYSFSTMAYNKDRQAAKTIAINLAVLTLAWLPYGAGLVVCVATGLRMKQRYINPLLTAGFLNSCFNTFLYSWRNREFRETFTNLLKCQDPNLIRRESVSSFHIRNARISTASCTFKECKGHMFGTKYCKDLNNEENQSSFVVCAEYTP